MKFALLFLALWSSAFAAEWRELPPPKSGGVGFTLLSAAETGVAFTNVVSDFALAANRTVGNGAGVGVGDFDGDGLPDIFACAMGSSSALYRNLGNWKFADVTASAGLPTNLFAVRGAVFADLNGDAKLDLLVSTFQEGVRCFMNSGGQFVEATDAAGLRKRSGTTTLALADVDGNGSLDLYVTSYRTNDIRDRGQVRLRNVGGKPAIPPEHKDRLWLREGQVMEYGQPDQLYLNDGAGKFTPVDWTGGAFLDANGKPLASAPLDWGLSATFRDVNGDGAPDLYVCNDYWSVDRFWINDGKGKFRAIEPLAQRKMPASSMGVDFADINRDGVLDFFAVEMLSGNPRWRKRQMLADRPTPPGIGINDDVPQVFQNTLFLGRRDGTYAEVAYYAGLAGTDWSWSPIFLDVDLDGYEDLLISAGHFRDVQDMDSQVEIRRRQHSWAGYTNEIARQRAYTAELAENYKVYPLLQFPVKAFRNLGAVKFAETNWGFSTLAVRHGMALGDFDGDGDLDLAANCLNGPLELYRNVSAGGRVAVTAPVGARIIYRDATGSQTKEMISGGQYLSGSQMLAVFAANAPASLEVRFRDGKRRVVEGVQPGRAYTITEAGATVVSPEKRETQPWFEDVSHLLGHTHQQQPVDDYALQPLLPFKLSHDGPRVSWDGGKLAIGADVFAFNGKAFAKTNALLPTNAVHAIHGTSTFVAGSVIPGKYPLAAPSSFLRLQNGEWKVDARNTGLLGGVGLVNAALWADVTADPGAELLLACEWGPVRVFAVRADLLHELTAELGLAEETGLWKGLAAGDFDGDGKLDVVASNWGLNSPWGPSTAAFYGEIVAPGRVEFIEAEWDAVGSYWAPRRGAERLSAALPFFLERFTTFKEYAEWPISRVLGDRQALAKQLTARTLASVVFFNRGGRFEAVPLPMEAQLAPAFAPVAADFDGDQAQDIFLAQNFFQMHEDYSRLDAGRGLLLKGDGKGKFKALDGGESGLKIYGEQRGAAVLDFDGDGRPDLAVSQNGAATKLYRNATLRRRGE